MSPIIDSSDLLLLQLNPDLVLIDARSGPAGREAYKQEHLKNARHVDLDEQLSKVKPDPADGGRHPLPSPGEFSNVLKTLGISTNSHVVVYDDKNGANAAARFWWMMGSAGHSKIQVLNGGCNAAKAAGYPSDADDVSVPVSTDHKKIEKWLLPLAGLDDVAAVAGTSGFAVIDVREKDRFDGIREPIDLVAGHIPGAINIPFTANLDALGFFLSPAELKSLYASALDGAAPADTIVHCGSGVTACHTLLAMEYAGLHGSKLYVGSWSEWSRSGKPISTQEQI